MHKHASVYTCTKFLTFYTVWNNVYESSPSYVATGELVEIALTGISRLVHGSCNLGSRLMNAARSEAHTAVCI